jgi:AraC-like DNA-binding protein
MRGRYERYPAPHGLAAYVEHLWLVEAPARSEPQREILIPNGRPSVVVCLAAPGVRHDPVSGAAHPNGSVVFGVTTRPYVLEQRGRSSYVGAQLTPWGLAAAFPAERLVDRFLPLDDWRGRTAVDGLATELADEPFGPGRARILAGVLHTWLAPFECETVRALVATVDERRGQTSVAELAARHGMSASTVYRVFRGQIGIGPKAFCEIVRYYHFTGGLIGDRPDSDALLAGLHGYYDQAHAARSFRRYTGVTASTFKQVNNGIARLMHAD